jgi:hypothetical protein
LRGAAAALAEEEDMKLVMDTRREGHKPRGVGLDWIGFGAATALLDSIDLRTEA